MKTRVIEPERLDHESDDVVEVNLRDLERLNRYFGGHATLIAELARLETRASRFTLLDCGAASGDYARRLSRQFPNACIVCLDRQARNLANAPQPRVQADAFCLPFADGSFDYVCASLFLHHFEDAGVETLLREFSRVARKAVIVNDIERHWFARSFLPATRWIFRWHDNTVHDGILSVRAGFKPGELTGLARRAGLRPVRVRRVLPWFRIAVVLGLGLMASCARRYPVEGLVVKVDREASAMTVAHRAIPGLMPAMTMPFRVDHPRELDRVEPGSRVSFQLEVRRQRSRASRIRVEDARRVDGEFRFPVPSERLSPGATVADFMLADEQGNAVRLSDLAGRFVAVNFLYTRCPLPDVCPRLAASFASVQRKFHAEMPSRLVLLSITLDPAFDRPEVLAEYARGVHADPARWKFLTGEVEPVAKQLGVSYWTEEGLIAHSSATALIGPDRRLIAIIEGSSFPLEQLVALIRFELNKK